MHSRRDQVKAYRFLTRRTYTAVLAADPNSRDQPMRRLSSAGIGSLFLTLIAVAVVGIIGVISPSGGSSWRDGRSLIVDRDTNTRYVYSAGVLHPVLNWASARLFLRSAQPAVVSVPDASIRAVPHGPPVGIPAAPDDLPDARALTAGPWSLCSQLAPTPDGNSRPAAALAVGWAPPAKPLAPDEAALVRGPDQAVYLLWQGQRLPLSGTYVVNALGMAAVPPVPVGDALLDTLSTGPTLRSIDVPGLGRAGPDLADNATAIGQVFRVDGAAGAGTQQFLLILAGGEPALRPLTQLQAAIQLADPRTAAAYPDGAVTATPLSSAALAELHTITAAAQDADLPAQAPRPVRMSPETAQLCVVYSRAAPVAITVRTGTPVPAPVPASEPVGALGGPAADAVQLPPGQGAVIRAITAPDAQDGTLYLVTGMGVKYAIGDKDALSSLGYAGVTPLDVPVEFTELLGSGPTLSTADARQEQPVAPAQR
jgi:type VII secretion protein EccB